jgi:hypothetical protein
MPTTSLGAHKRACIHAASDPRPLVKRSRRSYGLRRLADGRKRRFWKSPIMMLHIRSDFAKKAHV